jgi:neuronal guanine nucleotide exchange factor
MLWSEQPEVIESGLVDFMSEQERKLQEALFEVIDSEASYHQSLSIFTEHFMGAPELSETLPEGHRILDKQQRHVLFSNLPAVWEVATQFVIPVCTMQFTDYRMPLCRFHEALQQRWSENVKINTVCDIIQEFV